MAYALDTGLMEHKGEPKDDFLFDAFRRMDFVRQFEQKVWDLTAPPLSAIVGSVHLCAGQEAVAVGASSALREDDAVVVTYRGHGWALNRGVTPYEALSELCHRADGLNGGRAGSAMMMAPERGFIGENSIVGAGLPIACGVAMAKRQAGSDSVVLVVCGDGATSQGAVHEAMVFAAAKKLPVIFLIENNGWSEMTATDTIIPIARLSKRAGAYGFPGATIDGTDVVAVRDSVAMAADHARSGKGPSLIECTFPRVWGHYQSDIEHYRPKSDRTKAAADDPLVRLSEQIAAAMPDGNARLADIREQNAAEIERLTEDVLSGALPDASTARENVVADLAPAATLGPVGPAGKEMAFAEAVNAALARIADADERVIVYGEDCGHAGGIFGVTRNLQSIFGEDRVFDTPIAESAILGSAVGAAMSGLRPIVEIMWADFMLVALDQIVNQAANVRYVTNGKTTCPMIVRTQQGATPGSCAQHSQSLEALLLAVPGLRVGMPSNAADAYAMTLAASQSEDPVILIEARALYRDKMPVDTAANIEPMGGARLRKSGRDLTIVAWGTAVTKADEAAQVLAARGIDAGVLDLRWLAPLDEAALAKAAAPGRVIVVHEANKTGGFGAEIAQRITELAGRDLTAPIQRIGARDSRIPPAPNLQSVLLPQVEDIVSATETLMKQELVQ
ncbi:MAG: thiamine pyrophosphate-dependent enzyme [Pseudomonadota bacterium]|nr:thiamine pyrophosphate-dependent enzyme [Pseudomonadota bacterium]